MPIKTSLSDKEIDILKFISKTHRNLHESRIKRELQVVITTLSFYAACVAFKLQCLENNVDKNIFSIFSYAICIAFTVISICVYIFEDIRSI